MNMATADSNSNQAGTNTFISETDTDATENYLNNKVEMDTTLDHDAMPSEVSGDTRNSTESEIKQSDSVMKTSVINDEEALKGDGDKSTSSDQNLLTVGDENLLTSTSKSPEYSVLELNANDQEEELILRWEDESNDQIITNEHDSPTMNDDDSMMNDDVAMINYNDDSPADQESSIVQDIQDNDVENVLEETLGINAIQDIVTENAVKKPLSVSEICENDIHDNVSINTSGNNLKTEVQETSKDVDIQEHTITQFPNDDVDNTSSIECQDIIPKPACDITAQHEPEKSAEFLEEVNVHTCANIPTNTILSESMEQISPVKPVDSSPNSNIEINIGNPCTVNIDQNKTSYDILAEDVMKTDDKSSYNVSLDESDLATNAHKLNQPDVMLDIPTQELIDIDDSVEFSTIEGDDEEMQKSSEDNCKTINEVDRNNQQIANAVHLKEKIELENIAVVDTNVIEEAPKSVDIHDTQRGTDVNSKNIQHNDPNTDSLEDPSISKEPFKVIENITDSNAMEESVELIAKEIAQQQLEIDTLNQPSTSGIKKTPVAIVSGMAMDTDDEVPEVTDSLGLLAESSRVMEDDEEPEDDDDAEGDGDDDEDFYQDDESSNQMTAEQSEDSNAPQSETEVPKAAIKTPSTAQEEPFVFKISKVDSDDISQARKVDIPTKEVMEGSEGAPKTVSVVNIETLIQTEDKKEAAVPQSADIETVKLPDTSDNESYVEKKKSSLLRNELMKANIDTPVADSNVKPSPSKAKKLEISQQKHVLSIVDLEESSSDDDTEMNTATEPVTEQLPEEDVVSTMIEIDGVTSVNIPSDIEVMSSGGNTSEILAKPGEVVISGVPKPPLQRCARLNTSEVTIKTVSNAEPSLVIPEAKLQDTDVSSPSKLCLEIFNLDSDEDSNNSQAKTDEQPTIMEQVKIRGKCVNHLCSSDGNGPFYPADRASLVHYNIQRRRRSVICEACRQPVLLRAQSLINGIKDLTPLLDLEMGKEAEDLVEISDSDSEDETEVPEEPQDTIGAKGAKMLEENLVDLINETWKKYNMDARLKESQDILEAEMDKLEKESKEIDEMLTECQHATDKLRTELYGSFEQRRKELPALTIYDLPHVPFSAIEEAPLVIEKETRQAKRRLSSSSDSPAKRAPIPLGYAPLDDSNAPQNIQESDSSAPTIDISAKDDDDRDISVVKLSAESPPADLPPRAPGELPRAPLRAGMPVFAMKNAFGAWLRGKILECQPRASSSEWTMCRVLFVDKVKTPNKVLPGRCLAYSEPSEYRMTIGTRVIALFNDTANAGKKESYYSGIVAEIPNPVNNYRYLIFFDVGSAQYIRHGATRLVCESSSVVWEDMHPFSRGFVRDYLKGYPERPMVRLHAGQKLRTEWNGQWWSSRVLQVDASLVEVHFAGDGRTEWIYRGSTRLEPLYNELQVAQRHKQRALPRSKAQPRSNVTMPYVEYTRTDEQGSNKAQATQEQPPPVATPQQQKHTEEMRRQRAVAKKSTSVPSPAPVQISTGNNLDSVTSRVVYYTPKNAVKPYKLTTHTCGPKCKRSDVLALKDLRTYNPLAKPLLSGWERQLVRFKGQRGVMYRAPCGRRVRSLRELHGYLRATHSDMPVDLFDFHPATHCLAEFVLNKCIVWKRDLSHGKENVPVPCVNYYDESLPEFCSYNTERTPTAGVPLNLDPEFLCGCDCTDDCEDKSKCACWRLTLEGARTIGLKTSVGYTYRRLPEPLPSGIYECNSRCKCKNTCLNRVVQHPLQLKLQVFKTLNRGWGIRALNDVPKGSFLCVYAGNLLTDATANLDGLNEGDEYLAELDYIEVVEQMKEGYEEDIPKADKALNKKESGKGDETSEESSMSEDEEEMPDKNDRDDDDFQPGFIGPKPTEFNKRLRRRVKEMKDSNVKSKEPNKGDDCITISDDEEVREPTRFTAQAGMGVNEFVPKYKSVRSHFGEDEACYIVDAKVQGNIGRYLNHSCCPNVFVQNVFVDTHDPRFPWVSFFALSHIRAGTELTWNYNYDIGSVPGKVLYCYCGAPNCRGRLL